MQDRIELLAWDDQLRRYAPAPAEILSGIRSSHLRAAASWSTDLAADGEEDRAWDWTRKVRELALDEKAGLGAYESYALICSRELQALMLIETGVHRSRDTSQRLVYVEYLATAPRNRALSGRAPRFRRCGASLLYKAIERSRQLRFGGRIALHALEKACGFYVRLGMEDYGPDRDEGGLHYFEGVSWPGEGRIKGERPPRKSV